MRPHTADEHHWRRAGRHQLRRNRGMDLGLSAWNSAQRKARREGKLSAERTSLLEAIPGWH